MAEQLRQFTLQHPILRRVLGVVFLVLGFISLVTPLTPGALLMLFLGCEFLGLRFLFLDNLKSKLEKRKNK